MATLEAIRGGGGSIRVGTIGTISSLMTRELESSKSASSRHTSGVMRPRKSMDETSSSTSSSGSSLSIGSKVANPEVVRKTRGQKSNRVPVVSMTPSRRPEKKTPLEDVGNSSVRHAARKKVHDSSSGKPRIHRSSSKIPMLGSENIHLDKTPLRESSMKKGLNIVDIVDVNCGNPSLSNRLKKLGFSKLSQSFV